MKLRQIFSGFLAGLVAGLLTACSKSEKETEKPTAEESRVHRGTNGETIVTLDEPTRNRMGLIVESLKSAQWQPEVTSYGRVLDPAPLAALVAELESARAAAEASREEYERLKVLAEQNNASARALQAAQATTKRDQLLVDSASAKLALGWGKTMTERSDLPALARSLTLGEAALVRLDLSAGETLSSPPVSARLESLADEKHPVAGEFFSAATTVDPQAQGLGFLFLAKGNGLAPGTAITGYLRVPGEASGGVIVPGAAVLRHEGKAWVYLQTGEGGFVRREISLDRPADKGWFIAGGITAKDRVVVSGAQTILSEEVRGGGFRGGDRE